MSQSPFRSYAQTMEDVMLWRVLGEQPPGFYIDVGAGDPEFLSVTHAFYDRGWRGLDVEPLPEKAALLRAARPRDIVVQAALSDAAGRATFHRVIKDGDVGLSTLDPDMAGRSGAEVETFEVAVTTLADLCREHVRGDVHFLKVDVEGAEAFVLRGFDFSAVRPWIILVEAARPGTGEACGEDWHPILENAGYEFVWFDGLNRFYVAQERGDLRRHFQLPPNPFDGYEKVDFGAERRIAELEALAASRLERIRELEAQPTPAAAAPAPVSAPAAPLPRRRPRLHLAYGLVRPVVRPLAWRLRTFLVGPLQDEVGELRAQQEAMRSRLEELAEANTGPALEKKIADVMGQALLTLALDREGR